jgi:hypothetical protein
VGRTTACDFFFADHQVDAALRDRDLDLVAIFDQRDQALFSSFWRCVTDRQTR